LLVCSLLLLIALVACQSPAATATVASASPTAVSAATREPTKPPATEPPPTATPRTASTPTPGGSSGSSAEATPAWKIPEIREEDWVKGDVDAGLVLVEYSDFQ
jgi:hypothetical protein